jgi:hypothetical protein
MTVRTFDVGPGAHVDACTDGSFGREPASSWEPIVGYAFDRLFVQTVLEGKPPLIGARKRLEYDRERGTLSEVVELRFATRGQFAISGLVRP